MTRKVLIIFSLIGFIVSVWLWVRSYESVFVDTFGHSSSGHKSLMLYRGNVSFTKYGPAPASSGVMPRESPAIWTLRVPIWSIALLFGVVLPGTELALRLRRRRRRKMGLCIKCGYDLRGSKERCPECGTACRETAARLQRSGWVSRAAKTGALGKAAALSIFTALVVGMWYLLGGVARSVFGGDLISYVSAKTGSAESMVIALIIALIVAVSFVCSRLLYARITFRRIPDSRNADRPVVESRAGKNSKTQHEGKTALDAPKGEEP